mgnify:CR=1
MNEWMDVCMDGCGWMDPCMDGCMDEWMQWPCEWMPHGWMMDGHACVDEWCGWMGGWMDACIDECNGWIRGSVNGWRTNGWMNECMDGCVHG